ncbi:hypothetical protein AMTR_s00050p00214660 [Amborella trichopoda]|uniref:Uncharacterized protein n=1 Tax=Amborella trichopoda TaxID=13333 RepID=W1PSC9_AMBTC|nr:hypothetical protein AMTR_s00050p00214660 [Amborella trichopoda]
MATPFGHRCLVFNVDPSYAPLHEELAKLHHGTGFTKTSISIYYCRLQVIYVRGPSPLFLVHVHTTLPLLPIVLLLSKEELFNFVGDNIMLQSAKSRPCSFVEVWVGEHCHPDTHTVSRYLVIKVTWTGSRAFKVLVRTEIFWASLRPRAAVRKEESVHGSKKRGEHAW